MEDLDTTARPHCPEDDIVMRAVPHGWQCPHCGHLQLRGEVEPPPETVGPRW